MQVDRLSIAGLSDQYFAERDQDDGRAPEGSAQRVAEGDLLVFQQQFLLSAYMLEVAHENHAGISDPPLRHEFVFV